MTTHSVTLKDADEIESFFLDATGMRPGYLQLSRGVAGLSITVAELAGVTLIWSATRGRVRWRDEMTGDGLHVGFLLRSDGPITAHGRRVERGEAQVWIPGGEMDLVMAGPYVSLDIGVDSRLVEALGWLVAGEPLKQTAPDRIAALTSMCTLAARATSREYPGAAEPPTPATVAMWRDRVLDRLEPVLEPWLTAGNFHSASRPTVSSPYRVVRQADEFFESLAYDDAFEVDRLAQQLGIPPRTVFHAYRKVLGIGPRRYFELKRLQVLRCRLKRASKAEATVARIATELGFGDQGRMAALYRSQFAENPSDTLERQH